MDWRLVPKKKAPGWDGAQTRESQLRAEAADRIAKEAEKKAKEDLFAKKAAADAELQKMTNKKVTNLPRNAPGNPHNQFLADLIQGLQDGSIILRSVDARKVTSHPYTEMMVELLHTGASMPGTGPKPTGATGAAGVTAGPTGAVAVPPSTVQAVRGFASSTTAVSSAFGGPVAASGVSMVQKVADLPGASSYGLKRSESVEPVVGYRDFKLVQGQFGYSLQSRNGAIWPHRKKMRGLCNGNPFVNHNVPEPTCMCGIYAYDRPDNPSMQGSSATIWGEIAMWGEVLVCDTGYRAEFAYPTALFMRKPFSAHNKPTRALEQLRDELEDSYGVPVFILAERASKTAAQLMEEILQQELGDLLNHTNEKEES